jgi:hypothetical protein
MTEVLALLVQLQTRFKKELQPLMEGLLPSLVPQLHQLLGERELCVGGSGPVKAACWKSSDFAAGWLVQKLSRSPRDMSKQSRLSLGGDGVSWADLLCDQTLFVSCNGQPMLIL